MDLRVEKVCKSKRKSEIKEIYTSSFLKEDRMPFWMMVAMSYLWHTEFLAFYDGDVLCGFIYAATIGKQTFIMFFAVDEKLRSKGYGSRILNQMQARHPENKIIISIEPCDNNAEDIQTRVRRKKFYMDNGYVETGHFMKLGKQQEIIIKNGEFNKRKFQLFFMLYSNLTIIPKIWKADS